MMSVCMYLVHHTTKLEEVEGSKKGTGVACFRYTLYYWCVTLY